MQSNNQIFELESSLKSSYELQKQFINQLFNGILTSSDSDIEKLLDILYKLVVSLEFPFVILMNNSDHMDKLASIYFEGTFSSIIEKIISSCIAKFDFENKHYTSIESILSFGNILVNIPKQNLRVKDLSQLEATYQEYCNLLSDCQFYKGFIEENPNELEECNIKEILSRISKMVNNKLSVNGINNYPLYIYDYLQELTVKLLDYEDFFSSKVKKEGKNEEQIVNINSLNSPFGTFNNRKETKPDYSLLDPKLRTSFYLDEKILIQEGMHIEYKNYRWPLPDHLSDTLKNQICAFLNSQGGRIYLGISDDNLVKGVFLNPKMKDSVRNEIANLTRDFSPKCRTSKLEVLFVPVKNKFTEVYVPNLWIVKIIIKQGDGDKLYSVTSRGLIAYMRMPGQIVALTAEEIVEEIIKRKTNPKINVDEKEFIDVIPELPIENEENNEVLDIVFSSLQNKEKKRESNNKLKLDELYTLSVKNIPPTADKNTVLAIFKNTNYINERVFVGKDGYCRGWAFINFQT